MPFTPFGVRSPAGVYFATSANVQARKTQGAPVQPGSVVIDPNSGAYLGIVDGNGFLSTLNSGLSNSGAISTAMLSFAGGPSKPLPTRVQPYQATGATIYLDPTVAGTGTGTFIDPFKAITSVTWTAGNAYLFKAGTVSTIAAPITPSVNGTAGAPIIIGVYDATTGLRLSGVGTGLATVDGNNAVVSCFYLNNVNFICVDGIKSINNNNVTFGLVLVGGTSVNCQVLNCDCSNNIGRGIQVLVSTALGNNVVEGCVANSNGDVSLWGGVFTSGDNTRWTFNRTNKSLTIIDSNGGVSTAATVAGNVVSGAPGVGIFVFTAGGSPQIYRNTVRQCASEGIFVASSTAASTDFSGMLIENNDCFNSGEFGIEISSAKGLWLIQFNRIYNSGSVNGVSFGTANRFGRGIEIYGSSAALAPADGIIRFNYVSGTFNFASNLSEGVGIGLDNNCSNISVYGNYCVNNEGQGIQLNTNLGGCRVFGNAVVNSNIAPAIRGGIVDFPSQAGIAFVASPNTKIFNNTVIQYGASTQLYGISENGSFASRNTEVRNNLLIGAVSIGIVRNVTNTAEGTNIVEGSPIAVANTSLVQIANGTGTVLVALGTSGVGPTTLVPTPGGIADGTGAAVDPTYVSLRGVPLAAQTPIGCMHAYLQLA